MAVWAFTTVCCVLTAQNISHLHSIPIQIDPQNIYCTLNSFMMGTGGGNITKANFLFQGGGQRFSI